MVGKVVSASCLVQSKYWKTLVSSNIICHELCPMGSEIWTGIYLVARQLGKNGCGIPRNHPIISDYSLPPPNIWWISVPTTSSLPLSGFSLAWVVMHSSSHRAQQHNLILDFVSSISWPDLWNIPGFMHSSLLCVGVCLPLHSLKVLIQQLTVNGVNFFQRPWSCFLINSPACQHQVNTTLIWSEVRKPKDAAAKSHREGTLSSVH